MTVIRSRTIPSEENVLGGKVPGFIRFMLCGTAKHI